MDVLRVLLSYGADPLLATYSGNTALSCTKDPNARTFLEGVSHDTGSLSCAIISWESMDIFGSAFQSYFG